MPPICREQVCDEVTAVSNTGTACRSELIPQTVPVITSQSLLMATRALSHFLKFEFWDAAIPESPWMWLGWRGACATGAATVSAQLPARPVLGRRAGCWEPA